ncbi:hypothetical protein EON80_03435 [bacterium]|nr:MAG: hypothetical protein EON80_03435 [bacterium]
MAAKEQAASERMTSAVSAGQSAGSASERGPTFGNSVSGGASNVPLAELATKDAAFRQNMLEVLQKSPELQALGKQRDDLSARLNASGR